MADDTIALKLVLTTIGAQKEMSTVAQGFDSLGKKATQIAANMNNTIRGRMLQGLAGVVRNNIDTILDQSLPEKLRAQALQPQIFGAAVGAKLGAKAGAFVQRAGEEAQGPQFRAAQAGTAAVRDLQALMPGVALSNEAIDQTYKVASDRWLAKHKIMLATMSRTSKSIPELDTGKSAEAMNAAVSSMIKTLFAAAVQAGATGLSTPVELGGQLFSSKEPTPKQNSK